MLVVLFCLALFAQDLPQGHVTADQLVTDDGQYQVLRYGPECDFDLTQDLYVVWGTGDGDGNQGAVLVAPDGERCGVLTEAVDADS